jgi:uncharacterized protein YukE
MGSAVLMCISKHDDRSLTTKRKHFHECFGKEIAGSFDKMARNWNGVRTGAFNKTQYHW